MQQGPEEGDGPTGHYGYALGRERVEGEKRRGRGQNLGETLEGKFGRGTMVAEILLCGSALALRRGWLDSACLVGRNRADLESLSLQSSRSGCKTPWQLFQSC